jgi:hypothetical protein
MLRDPVKRTLSILPLILLLSGCVVADASSADLFPANAGDYLRISGPAPDPDHGGDEALYQGPDGMVRVYARWVGEDQVETALSELPPLATDVGPSDALGPREGVFFTFGDEYHAAWGNGDWLFVISATTETARISFLAYYGF